MFINLKYIKSKHSLLWIKTAFMNLWCWPHCYFWEIKSWNICISKPPCKVFFTDFYFIRWFIWFTLFFPRNYFRLSFSFYRHIRVWIGEIDFGRRNLVNLEKNFDIIISGISICSLTRFWYFVGDLVVFRNNWERLLCLRVDWELMLMKRRQVTLCC